MSSRLDFQKSASPSAVPSGTLSVTGGRPAWKVATIRATRRRSSSNSGGVDAFGQTTIVWQALHDDEAVDELIVFE